ncbi:hypothetical protein KGA65_00595 [Ideonella sp. B7]|uniref:hypothetical protein n=1 Tax=Ideonella benzenivorans TaxID=2831643 RepID=UPI001CECD5A5|nr:hypothetical protein [Ideonella benzenivorans]MCA6215031.1 hypothetical protein [Ideonella benzenivorans]
MNPVPESLHSLPDSLQAALDGYPVEALLAAGLDKQSACRTLKCWIDTISHDLEVFPPASNDVLVCIKTQMEMAREGLAEVVDLCG